MRFSRQANVYCRVSPLSELRRRQLSRGLKLAGMLSLWVECRFRATHEAILRTCSCLNVPSVGPDFQSRMLACEVIKSDRLPRGVSCYRAVHVEDLWHKEAKRIARPSNSAKLMTSKRVIKSVA